MFRTYAALSALCSLVYLVGLLVGIILFFVNWKIAIAVLAVSVTCPPLAKFFDQKKFQDIYGSEVGREVTNYEWTTGKQFALRDAAIHSAVHEQVQQQKLEGADKTSPDFDFLKDLD